MWAAAATAHPLRLMVISDPHVLAPTLVDSDSEAAKRLADGDTKLVLDSPDIIDAMLDSVRAARPAALLIAGDLTFNGERDSHAWLAARLERLRDDGVPSFVIPGNHDIANPYAHAFGDDGKTVAPTVTAGEFATMYAGCGYDGALERDTASLSYVARVAPGVTLLALDSNRYDENRSPAFGDSKTVYRSGGRLKPSTLRWAVAQANEARNRGDRVIAMMHHHLLEHIDGEKRLLANYLVEDNDSVAGALARAGVDVVLTGHLHITDAVSATGGSVLLDVATGAATTYPFPMRTLAVDGSRLAVTTAFLADGDCAWADTGKAQLERGMAQLAGVFARRAWSRAEKLFTQAAPLLAMAGVDATKLPGDADALAALMMRYLHEPLQQTLLMVTRGGEDAERGQAVIDAYREGVEQMLTALVGEGGAELLTEGLMPRVEPLLRSALLDLNGVDTDHERHTEDLLLDRTDKH